MPQLDIQMEYLIRKKLGKEARAQKRGGKTLSIGLRLLAA